MEKLKANYPTKEQLIQDFKDDLSYKDIYSKYGITRNILTRLLKKYDIKKTNYIQKISNMLTKDQILKDLVEDGLTYRQVADKYGVSYKSFESYCNRLGIRKYDPSQRYTNLLTRELFIEDFLNGLTYKDMSKKYNVSTSHLCKIASKNYGLTKEEVLSNEDKYREELNIKKAQRDNIKEEPIKEEFVKSKIISLQTSSIYDELNKTTVQNIAATTDIVDQKIKEAKDELLAKKDAPLNINIENVNININLGAS